MVDQHLARDTVEAVHETREVEHRHLAGELARTADVGEQHRDLDLRPTDLLAAIGARAHRSVTTEAFEAACAHPRVLRPRRESVPLKDEGTRCAERRAADPASRARREEAKRRASLEDRVRTAQEVVPLLLGGRVRGRHRSGVPRHRSRVPPRSRPTPGFRRGIGGTSRQISLAGADTNTTRTCSRFPVGATHFATRAAGMCRTGTCAPARSAAPSHAIAAWRSPVVIPR
jgi:hypothetical protein